ncbi:ankyrin repeat domain-containing protein [Cohnella algarum]|uniref:ankyrin repeat domain-containing protein n=1 Tax=Cohnella algarum TaxID=2044859 RepID=UPI001966D138|nr:ankyrin repeat domain-containing protein [Cohnella algarum]
MFCTNCGHKYLEDENFCAQCGKPVNRGNISGNDQPQSMRQRQEVPRKRVRFIISVAVCSLLMTVGLTAGMFYIADKIEPSKPPLRPIVTSGETSTKPWENLVPAEVSYKDKFDSADELTQAAFQNNSNDVANLLADGADPTQSNAILVAAGNKNMKIMELLLKHGANPNYMRAGKTALNYAVENDDIEMAKFLLDSGADPNVSTESAIWKAVEKASTKMVKILLDYGADPNRTIVNNKYLLQFAKESGLTEIADLLKNAGAKESKRG